MRRVFTQEIYQGWIIKAWKWGRACTRPLYGKRLPYRESFRLCNRAFLYRLRFYYDKISKDAKVKGIFNGENGEEGEFELAQVEPGKFSANVPLNSLGFYNFNIREEENGEITNNYKGAFALQYSDEYKFNTNAEKLDVVVKETKGAFINKPEEVFEIVK